MKSLIAFIALLAGIIGGLYVGGYLLFFKPIYDAALMLDERTLTSGVIIITIAKCLIASPVGYIIFFIGTSICAGVSSK